MASHGFTVPSSPTGRFLMSIDVESLEYSSELAQAILDKAVRYADVRCKTHPETQAYIAAFSSICYDQYLCQTESEGGVQCRKDVE